MVNHQRWLSISFFAFFFTWGIFTPYWTGWLTIEKELSVPVASIIMGVGMIARSFSTFFIFPYLTRKVSIIRVMKWTTFLALILSLLFIPKSPYIVLFIITVLFCTVYPVILPAVESGASILMQKEKVHYGRSRTYGSIGYTVSLLLIGAATSIWSEQAILYMMIASLAAAALFFMRPAPEVIQAAPIKLVTKESKTTFKTLFSSKGFGIVLTLAILLQGAHASYYNYGFIFLDDLGVNGFYIGIILNIAIIFEIIFFASADRLLKNIKVSTMFLIAGIGSTLRWILIYLFPFTFMFIGTQLLHALSFGVAHFAFIKFISEKLPSDQIANAQGVYAAFAMGLSTAILTFFGGYLYELSPGLAFLGMAICSIPAIIIVLTTRTKFSF